jgi:superfamily II DNA or RNA helicase
MTEPRHPRAKRFVADGLFDDLACFSDLESRIASLPSPQERGDAFEAFVEAYLTLSPIHQARTVWPAGSIPDGVLQALGLPLKDHGADGVFEDAEGRLVPYQAKFRSDRGILKYAELSTFLAITDRSAHRLLVTNADGIADVARARSRLASARGSDLDRLSGEDFRAIARWLRKGVAGPRRKKKPRPHQRQALKAILNELARRDRATAVMPCGSGKTLVGLWAAEARKAKRIVVFMPSLALVRQVLKEWAEENGWGRRFRYRCVCSDETVNGDLDELHLDGVDAGFPITTAPDEVRRFLEGPSRNVRVVFSTYQSAEVVAAALGDDIAFDFGLFDEAHRTAGRDGATFGLALRDENIRISKRLFVTATPRHYSVSRRDKAGDARLVYSMDVPELYGRTAFRLGFSEAVRRGLICDYRVLISVVTRDMVDAHRISDGETIVAGEPLPAEHVAGQIALAKAIESHGVRRIFTYHRNLAAAKGFVGQGGRGIRAHLADLGGGGFATLHVNGSMSTGERDRIMRSFNRSERGILSNVRCLTEGVDLPAVDMVAFMSPKKSRVDIVQAIGRAMRRAPGKQIGYVLLPLFLDIGKGESIEDALARTEFGEIWNVLQALQEQDDDLAEIIREMQIGRGRGSGFDSIRFREKIEVVGPAFLLDELREAIAVEAAEALGAQWDLRYGELLAFKSRTGHCSPSVHDPDEQIARLARWVSNQRAARTRGVLSESRIRRLEEIGFEWRLKSYGVKRVPRDWEKNLEALLAYGRKAGHLNPRTRDKNPEHARIGRWVARQRYLRKAGMLEQEKIERLDEIGFAWRLNEKAERLRRKKWPERYRDLVEHRRRHGTFRGMMSSEDPETRSLGYWLMAQKAEHRKGTLPRERVELLEKAGVTWSRRAG